MTSFAYIFACLFTLLHLLPTVWVPTEAPRGCRLIMSLILIGYLVNSSQLCFIIQVAILWYPGASFG